MTNKNPFGPEVIKVQRHTQWSLQADNGQYYKVNAPLTLADFKEGMSYTVSGLISAKGAKYISESSLKTEDSLPVSENKPLPPPVYDKPKMDKPVPKKVEGRDFVKEAKGKTFSLVVAALAHNPNASPKDILEVADILLKGIEDRGYF